MINFMEIFQFSIEFKENIISRDFNDIKEKNQKQTQDIFRKME